MHFNKNKNKKNVKISINKGRIMDSVNVLIVIINW